MTVKEFTTLVERLEQEAHRNPRLYRWKVAVWSVLGYGAVLSSFGLMFAISAFVVAGFAAGQVPPIFSLVEHLFPGSAAPLFAVGVAIFFVQVALELPPALWEPPPSPPGFEVSREEAPDLFQVLDDLRASLATPVLHSVLITHHFNAAVWQRPQRGLLGTPQNFLLLGLPLLQALSEKDLHAILAHELSHLSEQHSRFSGRIYHWRLLWVQFYERLRESKARSRARFEKFFIWYVPRFNAHAFVLARADEYVADKLAAAVVGAPSLAHALLATQVKGRLMADFWASLPSGVAGQKTPPCHIYDDLAHVLRQSPPSPQVDEWVRESLKQSAGITDTHPSTSDRLASLSQVAPPIARLLDEDETAEKLLGTAKLRLRRDLSAAWRVAHWEMWEQIHRSSRRS